MDDQRDGHLSTRIPLFSPRNNRLVLARPTRRFRRRTASVIKEREDREKQMVNSVQRIVAALFLRPYVRRDKDADDPRSKGRRLRRSGKTMQRVR